VEPDPINIALGFLAFSEGKGATVLWLSSQALLRETVAYWPTWLNYICPNALETI